MESETKIALVAVTGGVAAYLIADYIQSRTPGNGMSMVERAVGAVAAPIAARTGLGGGGCTVVDIVATPYPLLTGSNVVDGPRGNANLNGIAKLAEEIIGAGSGVVIAGAASIESMNGHLGIQCYNCAAFGIHCRPSHTYPVFVSGTEAITSYVSGAPTQVEGYRRCLTDLKALLQSRYPGAVEAACTHDSAGYLRALGRGGYAPMYSRNLDPSKPNGIKQDFLAARITRLNAAGLLSPLLFT